MALPFHTTAHVTSMFDEDWIVTMNLPNTVTAADEGKAVSADAGDNSAKLCADNDIIIGRLEKVEVRASGTVGAISLKGVLKFPKTGTVNVGDGVIGSATPGVVKAAPVVTPTTAVAFTAAQLASLLAKAKTRVAVVDNTNNTASVVFG